MARREVTYRWTLSGVVYRVSGRTERTLRIVASRGAETVPHVSLAEMVVDLYASGYRARESAGREQPVVDRALECMELVSKAHAFVHGPRVA